ncbi:hypothetical protein [Streptomyces sp. BF23-18]
MNFRVVAAGSLAADGTLPLVSTSDRGGFRGPGRHGPAHQRMA